MTASPAGNYPLETHDAEIARLHVQAAAMAPDTETLLDRIGLEPASCALDLGCGPGGITGLLSRRVGPQGRVLGLDMNPVFLEHARRTAPANVTFSQGNAYETGLPGNSFDLVHMRFIASTAGNFPALLSEALRLAKPGGVIAFQEPDGSSLNCHPPHPDWDRLKQALLGAFAGVGADLELARRLYTELFLSSLRDVQYRTFVVGVRSGDPMTDYLPSTVESLRATVVRQGLVPADQFDGLIASVRTHLAQPGTAFTMYTVAQVWGRKAP